ncbi:tyrosine-type recombinase/integrase [Actimicrobium antarcticum]
MMHFLEHGEMINGVFVKRLNSAIRIRYIRLLERILTHMKVSPNPAQHACFDIYRERRSKLAGQDAPKVILEPADQHAFMQALPALPEATQGNEMRRWKGQRSRAMQALMLGAGLKVSEVLTLRMNQIGNVDTTGSLPVSLDSGAANHTTRDHRSQLRPFAVTEVTDWLAVRRSDKDASQLLFPAKRGINAPLDLATVYRQVKATFKRAGINAERWGGRTLRNAFAVRELEETGSTELVGELMGHRQERSTLYYQEAAALKKKVAVRS